MVGLLMMYLAGCSGIQTANEEGAPESYLEFDVEPKTAEIYLDDDFQGTVEGWHRQIMPIEPGQRRLELRAQGYISQRFDVDVDPDRWLTLRVRLEPTIDAPETDEAPPSDERDQQDKPLPTPAHPTAPDSAS